MLPKDMFEYAKKDFADFDIELDNMNGILIPGFYPDAMGTAEGRNIVVEFKSIKNRPIRDIIISVINQYRKEIDYIGPRGKVILAINNKDNTGLDYYDLSPLVFSNKENIKADLDRLIDSSKKLCKEMFFEEPLGSKTAKQIEQIKQIIEIKNRKSKDVRFVLIIIAAIVVFAIGILDGINIYEITYERLILIGIFVTIMVFPVVKKISINGYSVETIMAKDKEDKENGD